MTDTCTGNQH